MNWTVSKPKWVPHKYQISGIEFLCLNAKGILSWKPGLGKTSAILEAFRILKEAGKAKRMLVISTVRICQFTWPEEIEKWTQFSGLTYKFIHGGDKEYDLRHSKADILLMNYEGLLKLADLIPADIDVVVYDELTKMKHHNSVRYKKLKPYMGRFRYRWGATGSLLSNSFLTLFGQIYCIDLGDALGRFITHYRARYFTQDARIQQLYHLNEGADELITKRIKHLVHHVDPDDWLELPEMIENRIPLELPPKLVKQYKELREEFILQLESGIVTAANAGILSSKLRQFTSGAIYDVEREVQHIHDLKLDVLEELIEDLDGDPLFVIVHYKHQVDRIRARIGDVPYFGSGLSDKEAQKTKDLWNLGALPVVLAHPKSVAHGLNMQSGGANVFWFGLEANFEEWEQAIARLYRQGQSRNVIVHVPFIRNTIDTLVLKVLSMRGDAQTNFFEVLKTEL